MAYADYEFYRDVYGGTSIDAVAFPRLSNVASAYIDMATGGSAKNAVEGRLQAVQMAMCNLSDIFKDEEIANGLIFTGEAVVASESVGGWSKSYKTNKVSSADIELIEKRKMDALMLWLGNTGLLAAKAYYARGSRL